MDHGNHRTKLNNLCYLHLSKPSFARPVYNRMATTAQNTIWSKPSFQPDFIRGVAAHPIQAVSNTAAVAQVDGISETIERDQRAVQHQSQRIMDLETENNNKGGREAEEKGGGIGEQETRAQNQLTWELARALVGEELVLYPAIEKYLRDGHEMVEADRKLHDEVYIPLLYPEV